MYIYRVIPLTKLPRLSLQTLSYYSMKKFEIGQLIEVYLGNRKIPAIIIRVDSVENKKQIIKKSTFALKRIERELTTQAIFPKQFIKLATMLSDYYFTSLGLMTQRMLPPFFSKPSNPLLDMLDSLPAPTEKKYKKEQEKILLISNQRAQYYEKYIKENGVLMLVPQYLQLPDAEKLFQKNTVEIIQSSISQTKWRTLWKDAYTGNIQNIIGTRAALFTPFENLKTLIIENENNTSHVSWDMYPKFDARYAAELISELYGINIIEGDILPSIEKYHKATEEKWTIVKNTKKPVPCKIIDMREEIKKGNVSIIGEKTRNLIKNLNKKEKLLMLISRKGLSSAIICRDCGYAVKCTDCDTHLILHKQSNNSFKLVCHLCGKISLPPNVCPECKSHRIKQIGGGTQKAAQEIEELAPHLSVQYMDSDITKTPKEQEEVLKKFKQGKINILIATQMALKEHLLPKPNHSVVIMMDSILYLPEYRSGEKIFEAIWRLRNLTKKEVLVQTYHPQLSVFQYSTKNEFEPFYKDELKKRKIFSWPPYSQLIKLTFSDKDSEKSKNEAGVLKKKLETQIKNLEKNNQWEDIDKQVSILGPAPAFVPKVAGYYIWYILIKWPKEKNGKIKNINMRNKLLSIAAPNWEINIDPIDIV